MIPTKGSIALTAIKLPPWYVRGRPKKDHVTQMVESCQAAGPKGHPLWILPPIEIRQAKRIIPPSKKKGSKPKIKEWIELTDGRHRMLAAQELKMQKIPYLLKNTSDEEAALRQVMLNLDGKVALTKEDKYRAIRDLLAQKIQGSKIAAAFRMHKSTISLIASGKIGKPGPHGNVGKKRTGKKEPSNGIAAFFNQLLACHTTLLTMMKETENTPRLIAAARDNEKRNTFLLTLIQDLSTLAGIES